MGVVVTPSPRAFHEFEGCHTSQPTWHCSRDSHKTETPLGQEIIQHVCQTARFKSIIDNALRHPKILHYIRVAIITDVQLLRNPINTLPVTDLHHVTFQVGFDPSVEDLENVQRKVLAPFSDSVMPSPEELTLPRSDELDVDDLDDGWLYFRCGISSSHPTQGSDPVSKSVQQKATGGIIPPRTGSEFRFDRSARYPGDGYNLNPTVIAHWCWSGSSISATIVIEITPDAIRDAHRGCISENMRLVLAGEEEIGLGPLTIPMKNGRSGLLSIVNDFIKDSGESLGLMALLSSHDKQMVLDMVKTAHSNLWERFQKIGPIAFDP